MALVKAGLKIDLEALFADPPATVAECAAAWADAVASYMAGVIPASTTVSAAQAPLAASLTTAFGNTVAASTAAAMEAAFLTFATSVGGGMTGAGFAGTPPPSPVGFAALFAQQPETHGAAATGYADAIDVWAHAGIATLIAPPFTATAWS